MPRWKEEQPTAAELEVLQVLWDRGPLLVRDVMDILNVTRPRAYTSVMSLMSDMAEKGLLTRTPKGNAFIYAPKAPQEVTLTDLLGDFLKRAFKGSANTLVAHLLSKADPEELAEIQKTLSMRKREIGGK